VFRNPSLKIYNMPFTLVKALPVVPEIKMAFVYLPKSGLFCTQADKS
jgi:hypothetical protein